MANVLMKRTVFDGKIYHRAGEKVDINGPTLKKYLEKDWCDVISEEVKVSELGNFEEDEIETKEEKEVYETKEKKLRTRKK